MYFDVFTFEDLFDLTIIIRTRWSGTCQPTPWDLIKSHPIKLNPIADSQSIWVILIVWEQKKVSQMLKCAVKDWEFGIGLGCDSPPGWPCLQSRAHFLEKLPAACQKSLSTPRSLKKNEKPWKTAQKSSDGILRFAPIHFPEKLPAACQKSLSTPRSLKKKAKKQHKNHQRVFCDLRQYIFPEKLSAYCQKFFSTLVFLKRIHHLVCCLSFGHNIYPTQGPIIISACLSGSPYPLSTFVKVIRCIYLLSTPSIVCISCHNCRQLVSAVKACVSCQSYTFWPIDVHKYDLALVLVQVAVTIKAVLCAKSVNNSAASLCIKYL